MIRVNVKSININKTMCKQQTTPTTSNKIVSEITIIVFRIFSFIY